MFFKDRFWRRFHKLNLQIMAILTLISIAVLGCHLNAEETKKTDSRSANWPFEIYLPEDLLPKPKAGTQPKPVERGQIQAWAPEGAKRIRGFFFVPNNTDSVGVATSGPMRAVARKHEIGMIYDRDYGLENDLEKTQAILDLVAENSGIVEFKHAPWVSLGKSSRGRFPFYLSWKFPKRTIASIAYHAETPPWPPEPWAKFEEETILHLNYNGEVEWGGTFGIHVRPSLLNYHANSPWLAHIALGEGVGHDVYPGGPHAFTKREAWEYMALFVDKALSLRLPEGYPSEGPLPLKKVDKTKGLLIETFAMEDLLRRPRMALIRNESGYVVNPKQQTLTNGFAKIPPAQDYQPEEGVPVVALTPGVSPTEWLLTKGLNFALAADPQQDVNAYLNLRPKLGETVKVEGKDATFTKIAPREVGVIENVKQGVSIKNLGFKGNQISLLGYTVLKVEEPVTLKVNSLHSEAVRLGIVLNGVKVDHRQLVMLDKGLYPMLFVMRMKSVLWGECIPGLLPASAEEIAEAQETQTIKERDQAAYKARMEQKREPSSYIRKYLDVPEAERNSMFWIADEELAQAWLKLHDTLARRGQR